jgi:hypothetical protein
MAGSGIAGARSGPQNDDAAIRRIAASLDLRACAR